MADPTEAQVRAALREHTPALSEIRDDYIAANTRNYDEFQTGVPLAEIKIAYATQFNRAVSDHVAESQESSDALTAAAKAQVIEDAMEEVMAQPKRGAWLILRDIAAAYRADGENMTVDTDPSADEHRNLIGFLRENADDLGVTEGWSTEDRREALREALTRWTGPSHDRLEQRDHDLYGQGARQGFVLGAEWWKLTRAAHPSPEADDRISRAIDALSWRPDHDGDDPARTQDDYMRRAQAADTALAILTENRKGAF
jgi:hypothetical protein